MTVFKWQSGGFITKEDKKLSCNYFYHQCKHYTHQLRKESIDSNEQRILKIKICLKIELKRIFFT